MWVGSIGLLICWLFLNLLPIEHHNITKILHWNCSNLLKHIIYPVPCPKLTLIQPTWSAYSYHLVFLIWYLYSLVFLIWYPNALTSLYGNTAHCSMYGIAMGCYGLFIVPKTAIVSSQWFDRYCFTGYARTWARHPTTPWQRECTAITSIDSLLDSKRLVTHFAEITPYILREATVG